MVLFRAATPRTAGEIEALVCWLMQENTWGGERIPRELLKLDIALSKGCTADVLRRNGLPPSPERKGLTWRESLSCHAEVMLCADMFMKEIWTFGGLKTAYVLFIIDLEAHRIILAEATFCPHGRWMSRRGRNLLMECDDPGIAASFVLHDRDGLFIHDSDKTIEATDVRVVRTPFRAPSANAHEERWVRSVSEECLDHLVLFGIQNLRRTLWTYREYFNSFRPHQALENRIPWQAI